MSKPLEILGKTIAWIITILGAVLFILEIYSFRSWINDSYFRGFNIIIAVISLLMFSVGVASLGFSSKVNRIMFWIVFTLMILLILLLSAGFAGII